MKKSIRIHLILSIIILIIYITLFPAKSKCDEMYTHLSCNYSAFCTHETCDFLCSTAKECDDFSESINRQLLENINRKSVGQYPVNIGRIIGRGEYYDLSFPSIYIQTMASPWSYLWERSPIGVYTGMQATPFQWGQQAWSGSIFTQQNIGNWDFYPGGISMPTCGIECGVGIGYISQGVLPNPSPPF